MTYSYQIVSQLLCDDEGNSYYYVYHPELGYSECSAIGDTFEEAINALNDIRITALEIYKKNGWEIPIPIKPLCLC